MQPIKLDNLYLGINDDKMNFLSLIFIPMTHNKHLDSYFFENPITSEITEVKHSEKFVIYMVINNMNEFLIQLASHSKKFKIFVIGYKMLIIKIMIFLFHSCFVLFHHHL